MDNKLKKKSDFDRVFKKGKRCYAKSLLLIYIPSKSFKIGYSVSKKNGGAVVRNRIKRYLRAITNEYKDNFVGSYYIVILAKPAEDYSFKIFKKDVEGVLIKEKLIKDIAE